METELHKSLHRNGFIASRKDFSMTFREQYEKTLTVTTDAPSESTPAASYYAGSFYEQREDCAKQIPTVFCGGSVKVSEALTLSYAPLNCRMLLYTQEGEGTLLIEGQRYPLKEGTLLYLDRRQLSFSLLSDMPSWNFIIFSFGGGLFPVYESLASFDGFVLAQIERHSSVLRNLKQLLSGKLDTALSDKLRDAGLITAILTELFAGTLAPQLSEEGQKKCAPYLRELKHYIDHHLERPLKLEDLEKRCHMSKYRICHEFSAVFGLPPIKYLNKKRMEAAENLLLSTEKKVHEIAQDIGFENTNHFIHLFKKEYGATPQAYREAHHT